MVPIFGIVETDKGILSEPKKVEIIKGQPSLTNIKELQSFLSAVNYLSKYMPEL